MALHILNHYLFQYISSILLRSIQKGIGKIYQYPNFFVF